MLERLLASMGKNSLVQSPLTEWEMKTVLGSEQLRQGDVRLALKSFDAALEVIKRGMLEQDSRGQQCQESKKELLHYYTLASMNVAHVLERLEKRSRLEKVLSDAHFNMLALMADGKRSWSLRQEARLQAEALLINLKAFLNAMGRRSVAESLQEEFRRLRIGMRNSQA